MSRELNKVRQQAMYSSGGVCQTKAMARTKGKRAGGKVLCSRKSVEAGLARVE